MPQSGETTAAQINMICALFLAVTLSIHLLSPTSLALSFSVDKLAESLTTQPGKIARSHAAKRAYP